MHEWSEFVLSAAAKGCFDNTICGTDHRGQLGARVDIQFLINVHQVRGYSASAYAEPLCDLSVRKAVDDVAHDLSLAIAKLLVKHGLHLSLWNEVGYSGPIGIILAPHQRAKFIRPMLIEKVNVMELPGMFHSHRNESAFVFGGEDLSTGRASEPQPGSLKSFNHAKFLVNSERSCRVPTAKLLPHSN
jgi:hypothetical protein